MANFRRVLKFDKFAVEWPLLSNLASLASAKCGAQMEMTRLEKLKILAMHFIKYSQKWHHALKFQFVIYPQKIATFTKPIF
jgi:hypothetical protein